MPVNPRRQTLAGAQAKPPPPPPPSSKSSSANSSSSSSRGVASSNSSVGSGGGSRDGSSAAAAAPRRRVPMSRKSMIPRCAGPASSSLPPSSGSTSADANRENNGRAVGGGGSGIAAPSPSSRHHHRPPSAMRKSLGGAILQYGHGSHGSSSAHAASYTPAKNRRVSLAPPAASSSSSSSSSSAAMTASVPGSSSNVDPRDVRDRSYLQSAIRKMVSYLSSRGYADASSLNVKQLVNSGPSGRDFQNIMTFLFRRVDPTFHSSTAAAGNGNQRSDEVVPKFEDEVSMAFRCLGYPFPISKTGLVAVGSPHTWPALIAAIDWLVDLLAIMDEEEQLDWGPDDEGGADGAGRDAQTLDGSAERVQAQFHKFLRKSMVAFLNDDNDECEELEGALLDTFQKDSERVEVYLTGLDYECGKMRDEIAALNEEVNGLSEAQQKQEEYAANIEKFLNLIQTLNDHKAELTTKVETLTIEKSTTEREMQDCSTKIEELRGTIDGQELSQEDVRRMEREKARIEEQISKHGSVLEGQVAALKEAKEKWCAIYKLLERKVDEYNARARQLELVPETARHARGKRFEVKLNGDKAAEGVVSMMGGVDIVGAVEPHVTKLIKHYESETANEKRRMAVVKDLIKAMEISKGKLVEDIEAIKDRINSCEDECEDAKERLEADIQDKRRQLELLNSKILSLNDPKGVESTIKKLDAEYEQLQIRQQKEEKKNIAKIMAVTDEIRRALTLAKEYEAHKKKRLEEMNSYIRQKQEECENIKLLDS